MLERVAIDTILDGLYPAFVGNVDILPELVRSNEKVRRTLTSEIRRRRKKLHDLTPANVPAETRREQVAGALACMVGGLILARGMKESEGLEFLKDCHSFLRSALANSDAESTDAGGLRSVVATAPPAGIARKSGQKNG